MPATKLLAGKPAIKAVVGTTKDYVLETLVMLGLPVVFINDRWFSSTDAIDTWLKEFFLANRGGALMRSREEICLQIACGKLILVEQINVGITGWQWCAAELPVHIDAVVSRFCYLPTLR